MDKISNREKELFSLENPEDLKYYINMAFGQYVISEDYLKRDEEERLEIVKSWLGLQEFCLSSMKEAEPEKGED